MWYAAHVLLALEFQDGQQDLHPIWEQIHIIDAASSDQAYEEADRIGQSLQQADTGEHTYDNRPVRWRFAGIRRLAECIDFGDGPPESGKEVTYLSYFLKDETGINRLLNNLSTELVLEGEDSV